MAIAISKDEVEKFKNEIINLFRYLADIKAFYTYISPLLAKAGVVVDQNRIQAIRLEQRDQQHLDIYIYLETIIIDIDIYKDSIEIYISPLIRVDCSS